MDINYLRAIHHSVGALNAVEAKISEAKNRLTNEMVASVNYRPETLRNGLPQPMVMVPTQVRYKCSFVCLPGDDIHAGDFIESFGQKWVVIETNTTNPIQHIGMAWLCNHMFRFQNWDSNIVERWGVLDSGVYSTTQNGNGQVQETDKQFKIYLPYDADTKKIYVDKRFAVDTRYDAHGNEILEVYKVTGMNSVARSYGDGAHLLILEVRSDNYSPDRDNIEEMVCDYIQHAEPTVSPVYCRIDGRDSIRIGSTRRFTSFFYTQPDNETIRWRVTHQERGVSIVATDVPNTVILSVPDDTSLIGSMLTVSFSSADGQYIASKHVEVTS